MHINVQNFRYCKCNRNRKPLQPVGAETKHPRSFTEAGVTRTRYAVQATGGEATCS
jgi:hypothetical protein